MSDLSLTMACLRDTALRVKSERDQAMKLLREVLHLETLGSQGPYKTKVREFLAKIEEDIPA